MNRLDVVADEVEKLHLRSYLMGQAGRLALQDQLPMILGPGGTWPAITRSEEVTADDMQSLAGRVADMVRRSDLPVEVKAYWLSMWLEVAQMTSRLMDLFDDLTPPILDAMKISSGKLGMGFNAHPEHLDTARLSAVMREHYYATEKPRRPALVRDAPRMNDRGGSGQGFFTLTDGKARNEPYTGTPAAVGAR